MLGEPGAFDQFYRDMWAYDPFDWQRELVDQVYAESRWPDLIDLPTGAGKTSTIDVALFLLARDAARPTADRVMPRRIITVVDRRVVVDQAYDRARELRQRLHEADPGSVAHAVAEGLRRTWSGSAADLPFTTSVLRGGIVRDESWARRPDVPAVIASTVDQVGSRLLFRGYGLSPRMAPLHAGLLGTDTLLLLDEVHLSQPFAETLRRLSHSRPETGLPERWVAVELSATPGHTTRRRFPDRPLDPASSVVLRRRLLAAKPAQLEAVKGRDRAVLARRCAASVSVLLAQPHVRALAVVVNRVQTAREVAQELSLDHASPEVVVLTGRVRPLDRDRVVARLRDRLSTGRRRTTDDLRLVVVATQCIEAGADFDFDGLVTECASLPALRQRFGRVDRDGRLAEAGTPAPGVILALAGEVSDSDDPVYGSALATTWEVLEARTDLDFGITALERSGLGNDPRLAPTPTMAPHLLPAHLDAWVQTQPRPTPDPDPALWLHGLDDPGVPDVQVVWRADVTESLLGSGADVLDLVTSCPPVSAEAMSVPINAVRAWLTGSPVIPVADVEGVDLPGDVGRAGRAVLRWRADDPTVLSGPAQINPGDVLVVPATYGGVDGSGNWAPDSSSPVPDLGHDGQAVQRQRVVLRLVPALWPRQADLPLPTQLTDELDERVVVVDWLRRQVENAYAQHCAANAGAVRVRRVWGSAYRWVAHQDGHGGWAESAGTNEYFVVSCLRPYLAVPQEAAAGYDPEGDQSTFIAQEVELDEHLRGVERWARRLATDCGLSPDMVSDVALAGRLHDLGKADPRFQVILYGGDEIGAGSGRLLAKSGLSELDRRQQRRVQERSGYPSGTRHELMSLALIEGSSALEARAHDWDLVLHLVSSHHGRCRPFAPAVPDPDPRSVQVAVDGVELAGSSAHGLARLDSGVPQRFWTLVRRYGPHGLAWLEAILQLADHQRSAEEQSLTEDPTGART